LHVTAYVGIFSGLSLYLIVHFYSAIGNVRNRSNAMGVLKVFITLPAERWSFDKTVSEKTNYEHFLAVLMLLVEHHEAQSASQKFSSRNPQIPWPKFLMRK